MFSDITLTLQGLLMYKMFASICPQLQVVSCLSKPSKKLLLQCNNIKEAVTSEICDEKWVLQLPFSHNKLLWQRGSPCAIPWHQPKPHLSLISKHHFKLP